MQLHSGSIFYSVLLKGMLLVMGITGVSAAHSQDYTVNDSKRDSVIEERLVELALTGPEARKIEHENLIYQYQLKAARNSWMNFLTFSINYNDQTFNQNATYVYPKYFFGVNIPIGTFISGKQTKIAKESVAIGALNQEEMKRTTRKEVVGLYRKYKAQGQLISIETGFMNDLQAALTQAEDKFRKGTITFDAYNAALKNKNDQQGRIINLKLEQELTKLDIERMIGTSLESVIK